MHINKILLALFLALPSLSLAEQPTDIFNTYLWNRDNALAQNGEVDRGQWYEWWYFKVVDPDSRDAFFFTYGVINPWDQSATLGGTRAVVQVGNFAAGVMVNQEYPVGVFNASYDKTEINVAGNVATDHSLRGHINKDGHDISWDLQMERDWRFEAMGWAMHMPELSGIYWYPAQASAHMSGTITFDGKVKTFNEAPAYQDRNWGRTFPEWWTWLTSNHFKNSPGTTLAAGGGRPKIFNSLLLIPGICIGLTHEGQEYVFRTTDADLIRFDIRWGTWSVAGENKNGQRIEISAYAPPEKFLRLPFRDPAGPVFYDYEALLGHMTVKLYDRFDLFTGWHLKAELETDEAGIEWGTPDPIEKSNALSDIFMHTQTLQ